MSRHHYALFVHNCRLVLLLRREPSSAPSDPTVSSEGASDSFQPAEWRWKLPEVCDAKWHHYAVSVEFPDVCESRRGICRGWFGGNRPTLVN